MSNRLLVALLLILAHLGWPVGLAMAGRPETVRIQLPMKARLDTAGFRRILVGGFLHNDSPVMDIEKEIVRVLRTNNRRKRWAASCQRPFLPSSTAYAISFLMLEARTGAAPSTRAASRRVRAPRRRRDFAMGQRVLRSRDRPPPGDPRTAGIIAQRARVADTVD